MYGHLSTVKLLIESRANIHARNDRAIIFASYCGNLPMIELLINSGADIHAQNKKALKCAEMYE